MPLPVDKAIPAGLILNELISNVLKHAFPIGSGSLWIRGQRNGSGVILSVCDNGTGMPAEPASNRKSLGLEIVAILTRQLKGTFHIASNDGVTAQVSFPVS